MNEELLQEGIMASEGSEDSVSKGSVSSDANSQSLQYDGQMMNQLTNKAEKDKKKETYSV